MHILTILILALSSNLDNLGVGLAYGVRKIKLPVSSNLLIAVVTSCGTVISMILGKGVAVSVRNQRIAGEVGAGIMIAVGLYLILQSLLLTRDAETTPPGEPRMTRPAQQTSKGLLRWLQRLIRLTREPSLADWNYSRSIEPGEAAMLGIALTLNNLPNGFAAGLINLGLTLTTIAVFIFSLFTLLFGIWVGTRFVSRFLRHWAGPAAGVILVLLGVYELFS